MKKINETFDCIACARAVPKADKTCRNHCPFCFVSQHVDGELPGDRTSTCSGRMIPIEYEISNKGTKIHFVCVDCSKEHRNKAATDDDMVSLNSESQKRQKRRKEKEQKG